MAPFSLIEVKTPETEMTELVRHLVTSFREPPHTYIELVFAEETFDSYDAAIENLVERQTATLQPNCTWLKVVDEESGRIAGAACWRVFDENPYQKAADPIKCTWWPEGSVNDLTCMWMEAITTSRRTFMARPHVCAFPLLQVKILLRAGEADCSRVELHIHTSRFQASRCW